MEPVDRSPPGGEALRRPPKHPKTPLPGVWQKARALCEEVLSSDASKLDPIECATELKSHWELLQVNGEIPSHLVRQYQTTLMKLRSIFEETLIPEELRLLSSLVDHKRLQQIFRKIAYRDKYIDPMELATFGREVLEIYKHAKKLENGVTPLSNVVVFLATKALSIFLDPSFLELETLNLDLFYEKLKEYPHLFSQIDHDLARKSLLDLYRSSTGNFSKEVTEKIVFIGTHLLLSRDDEDIKAIVEKLKPTLLRGPDLVLSEAPGSDKNFSDIHTFLLTSRPTSMDAAKRLADEFLRYFQSHQYGVTIKQAASMHAVASALDQIVENTELKSALGKIRSSISEYEEEIARELTKLSSIPLAKS